MGWGDCGLDSNGRPIGYHFEATCDEPGCDKAIDRGLGYACGDMHGENGVDCEGYFCGEHINYVGVDGKTTSLCSACVKLLRESDEWTEDDGEFTSVD